MSLEAPQEYLRGHHGLTEHELRCLCEHLSKKSRSVRSLLEAVQSDVNLSHALLDDLRLLHIRGEWFRYVPEIVEHFDSQ